MVLRRNKNVTLPLMANIKNDIFCLVDNIIYSAIGKHHWSYFTKCFIIICNIADSDLQTSQVIQFTACNLQLAIQSLVISHAHNTMIEIIIGDRSTPLDKVGFANSTNRCTNALFYTCLIDY